MLMGSVVMHDLGRVIENRRRGKDHHGKGEKQAQGKAKDSTANNHAQGNKATNLKNAAQKGEICSRCKGYRC